MNIFKKVTINSIKKAKVRSTATFAGIVLATAMLVGVTSLVFSLNDYIQNSMIKDAGNYHFHLKHVDKNIYDSVLNDDEVEYVSRIDALYEGVIDIGQFEDDGNDKSIHPAQQIYGLHGKTAEYMGIEVYEGRLPKNSNEIIISDDMRKELGDKGKIGSSIKFLGFDLKHENYYIKDDYINKAIVHEYEIVGNFKDNYFDWNEDDCNILFTMSEDIKVDKEIHLFVKLAKDSADVDSYLEKSGLAARGADINDTLVDLYGKNRFRILGVLFLGFSFVYVIVVILACLLLGSAFSISYTERLKQYGLLASVGATKKQIKGMILKEAFYIALAAVPVGILVGVFGLKGSVAMVIAKVGESFNIPERYTYYTSPSAIVASIIFVIVTIILSATKSLIKASRLTPIEAIKQSKDIKINRDQVKIGKFTNKFGVEGTLAKKYFRTNKSKYRTTVVSLVISIVLFLISVVVVDYIKDGLEYSVENTEYSVFIDCNEGGTADEEITKSQCEAYDKLKKDASNVKGVDKVVAVSQDDSYKIAIVDTDNFTNKEKKRIEEKHNDDLKGKLPKKIGATLENLYLDDTMYMEVLKEAGIDEEEYRSWDSPKGIIYNVRDVDYQSGNKTKTEKILKEDIDIFKIEDSEAIYDYEEKLGEGYEAYYSVWPMYGSGLDELSYSFDVTYSKTKDLTGDVITKPIPTKDLEIAGTIEKKLLGVSSTSGGTIHLIYPESCRENLDSYTVAMISEKDNIDKDSLDAFVKDNNILDDDIEIVSETRKAYEAIIFVLQVFAYTFVIMASLIAVANVFNIITTNIYSRKRDFAMVQSIGLSYKSVVKMMIYECIIYGMKAILIGGIIGIAFQLLIIKSVNIGSVILVLVVVMMIVFISIIYAMRKMKDNNIIETLKDENI